MNISLLIAVTLTLSLAHGYNPCQQSAKDDAYRNFVEKHIIQDSFDRSSKADWENYLQTKGLSSRPRQFFMERSDEESVKYICNGGGYPIVSAQPSDLCISSSDLLVYDLTVNKGKVTSLKNGTKKVIVACDKVENQCRPVHFKKYNGQKPKKGAGRCMP